MVTFVLSVVFVYLAIGYVIGYRYWRRDYALEIAHRDNVLYLVVIPLLWIPMYVIVCVAFDTWKVRL